MVFTATFNNISVISWRSVLLVEETEWPGETSDLSHVSDKLCHIMLYTSPWSRLELTISVVLNTDCTGSCKSNYHSITATTASLWFWMCTVVNGLLTWWVLWVLMSIFLFYYLSFSLVFKLFQYGFRTAQKWVDSIVMSCILYQ